MDPSSYIHHHQHYRSNNPRYVPFSPPLHPALPPSHPPPYQQSPNNLYPSRHHLPPPQPPPQLRPPPPPPPPPPQQQSYLPLPAPPIAVPRQQHPNHHPYNPHYPQYTFNPNPNPNPNFNFNFNSNSKPNPNPNPISNPNNVSHQFHDSPQRRVPELDTRPDFWPDNRVSRSHTVSNLDREAHYHQFDRRPTFPGIDRFRHDLEGRSRFRDLELNQRERDELGRVHIDRWISDRSTRDFGMGFESSSNNLSFCDNEVTENVRWGSHLHDQLIDNGNNEINERDAMRVFSRKIDSETERFSERGSNREGSHELIRTPRKQIQKKSVSRKIDSETERFSERGSNREGSHELNRTPRKQIQKKSALLRIKKAKPNHRSREDERSHYLGYYNEGKTGTSRGKEEKEREGSPVELDVSFKSNSLVAKAIVMPRNTKIRRVMVFVKDCSSLQPNKANESSAKLYGSASVVNSCSGFEDSKKSEGKVKTSGTGNVQDGITKPCSKGTNVSLRKDKLKKTPKVAVKLDDSSCVSVTEDALISDKKPEPLEGKGALPCISNMVDGGAKTRYDRANVSVGENKVEGTLKSTVSDKTGASVCKPSSLKVTKKKTIVRKVVKKVKNSPLNLANSDSAKKGDQSVKADTSTRCPSAADKSVIPLKMKIASAAVRSVHGVVSECFPKESALLLENEKVNGVSKEVGTDVHPGGSVAPRNKRKRNSLTPPLSSSGHEETKVDQGSVNGDNSVHGLHIISNIKEDRTDTPNESITSGILIVEDVNKQFYHNESNINYGLSRSEDNKVHGDIVDIGSSSAAMHSSTGFDCGSSNTQEINIVRDVDHVNSGSKQCCATPGGSVVEYGATGGLPEANCSIGSNKMPHLPCSEETQIKSDSIHADCSNHSRSTICTPDIGYVNSGESNHEIGDDSAKHLSPSTLSLGYSGIERIPNIVESLECKDENAANVHKRKVGIGQLDLSSSAFTNISIGSADCLDTTISTSGINSNPAEAMISGIGWLDVGLQHSRDKVSILHRSSSNDTFPEVSASADGKSPEKKKRKLATSSSSVTASVISQEVAVSDIFKSAVQLPSNFTGDLLQLEQEVEVPSMNGLHTEGIGLLLINGSEIGPSQAVGYLRGAYRDDHPSIDPSAFVESVAPSSPCLHPLKFGGEQLSTATPVSSVNNLQIDVMDVEGDDREKGLVDTAEDLKIISSEVTQCRITPEHKSVSLDQRLPSTNVEDDYHLPIRDDLPSASNSLVSGVDANEVSVTNYKDEAMPAPDLPSVVGSPNNPDNLVISTSTCKTPFCQKSEEKAYGDEKLSDDKPMIEACNSSAIVSYSQHGKTILKSNDAIQTNQPVAGKAGLLPSHDSKNTNSPNFISGETHGRKNQLSRVVPKSYPTHASFVFSASKNTTSSTKITKPRTWHRTDSSSATLLSGNKPFLSANPLQRQMPKKSAYFQSTSYIRKGNSLVRKPVSVTALPQGSHSLSSSIYRLNSGVVDEVKKGTGPNSTADSVDLRTGGASTSFERPTTPPLSSVSKVPNHTSNSLGECTSSSLAEPSITDCCELTTNRPSCMEINDLLNFPEGLKTSETLNRNGSVNNLEHWTEQNEGDLIPSNAKRVTYVKPKSNQLVATSDCDHTSILNADKNQSFSASSDDYYKKSKNQLIRTALESHIKQAVSISDDKSNSMGHMAAKVIPSRTFGKRRSNKVVAKPHKPSKFSLVWTLHGARLSNNDDNSLRYPMFLPQLFPWKRMTYKRSFKLNSVSSCNSSLSTISRKMLLLRKRNTVYTRSINGFSIRKSKVLSVGGSSLKWSQSIERHSRKANEEATLAVAEAERKKRERNGTVSETGKRSHSSHKVVHGTELQPGERIFRIGSVHYKMDSSRRSLQRISDGKSSWSAGHLSENSTKKSYVPRRLMIGNEEYVRIGNGNQLVRDPKKRTRVLASEKVRWSLHTARLRLVKKGKYCQFFTRFGKCNKDNGKCLYIHDPSKIAVCTKFLKGLCSNPNCKLTHKVIPERMPDCSYFLQGLCKNENCPYRHVHVNPNASTCEGFLRGYCADGNECRKKHSYVCPNFEATGSCPQGSKCKLHHPKNRSKGKKSKRSMEHKNARGRYFGIDILEPKRMASERHQHQALDDDDIFFDGKFSDYISLDVSDDEAGELHHMMCDHTTFGDNDSSDLQLDDLDELIKPIRIMN